MPPQYGRDKDQEYDGSVNDSVELGNSKSAGKKFKKPKSDGSTNYKPSLLKPQNLQKFNKITFDDIQSMHYSVLN